MQLPLLLPRSTWVAPAMNALPSWKDAKRIALDCETRDPSLKELGPGVRRDGYVIGVSFSIEDGPTHYLPFRHEGGEGNLDAAQVIAYLRDNAPAFRGTLVGMNLAYDLDFLAELGIVFPNVEWFRDVGVADPLLWEMHPSYSLDSISQRLNFAGKDEVLLRAAAKAYGIDPKSEMYRLPPRFVGPYAEEDVRLPLAVLRKQERFIEERGLQQIWDLESRVLPVLLKMRRRGIRIDEARLERIQHWSLQKEAEILAELKAMTGVHVEVGDVMKAGAVAPVFEALGLKLDRTEKTDAPSITTEWLETIDHPAGALMRRARQVNKLRTTFWKSTHVHMTRGRLHCEIKQIAGNDDRGEFAGAKYGRCATRHTSLHQQPSRGPDAKEWRSIYLPEEGALWSSSDYSQQEPRWTTHFAAVLDLPGAAEAAREYHDNPLLDNHDFMAKLTGLKRKDAKAIFLGLCYGEGGRKLCGDLGLPTAWARSAGWGKPIELFETEEAARSGARGARVWEAAGPEGQRIIDTFNERAPYVKALAKRAEQLAKQRGWIRTAGGRVLNFPRNGRGGYDWTYKALNRLIQGTAADQVKLALVLLDQAGYFLQLQVHDEIVASVQSREEAEGIAEIMRNAMTARVPFRVDVEVGPSWGESMG